MSPDVPEILIIGMGNVLMQDEGIGVRAVEALENRYDLPPSVELIDGGTSGTELLVPLKDRKHVIVADAINTGAEPGTLVRLHDDEVPAFFQTKISNHQLGLSDLLAVLKVTGTEPENVTIVGMVPYHLENKLGLSEESLARLDEMVLMLVDELSSIGIEAKLKSDPDRGFWEDKAYCGDNLCA